MSAQQFLLQKQAIYIITFAMWTSLLSLRNLRNATGCLILRSQFVAFLVATSWRESCTGLDVRGTNSPHFSTLPWQMSLMG